MALALTVRRTPRRSSARAAATRRLRGAAGAEGEALPVPLRVALGLPLSLPVAEGVAGAEAVVEGVPEGDAEGVGVPLPLPVPLRVGVGLPLALGAGEALAVAVTGNEGEFEARGVNARMQLREGRKHSGARSDRDVRRAVAARALQKPRRRALREGAQERAARSSRASARAQQREGGGARAKGGRWWTSPRARRSRDARAAVRAPLRSVACVDAKRPHCTCVCAIHGGNARKSRCTKGSMTIQVIDIGSTVGRGSPWSARNGAHLTSTPTARVPFLHTVTGEVPVNSYSILP